MQEVKYKLKYRPSAVLLAAVLPLLVHCSDPVTPGSTASYQVFDYGSLPRAVGAAGLPWNAQDQRFDIEGDVAALDERSVVVEPVGDAVLGLELRVHE